MFLKKQTLTRGQQSVELCELSGLQRVEYLAFLESRTAEYDALPADTVEAQRQLAFMQMGLDINAWLVSRALWNLPPEGDVDALFREVQTRWSYDALGEGADLVLVLSGMVVDMTPDDAAAREGDTPEKP